MTGGGREGERRDKLGTDEVDGGGEDEGVGNGDGDSSTIMLEAAAHAAPMHSTSMWRNRWGFRVSDCGCASIIR